MKRLYYVLFVSVATASLGSVALASRPPRRPAKAPMPTVKVEMRNVRLHMTDHVALNVRALLGSFVSTRAGKVPNLDDSGSYVVNVDAGEIAVDEASLNALMNEHVFVGHKPPVKDLQITLEDGLVKQKGTLDKKIDIPFKTKGTVEATPDGKIRIHAKSIKGLGLPVKGLMKVLGIEMDDMLKLEAGHGVTVDENDFIIDPQKMMPPPRMNGQITSVRIDGDEMVEVFGPGAAGSLKPAATSPNHIYWRGGSMRFGKLTMAGTDLELIDQDPSDPFDFSVAHYNDMLVAGYSRNTAARGLKTYMPDYDDMRSGQRVAHTPGAARRMVRHAAQHFCPCTPTANPAATPTSK
jgi:hypothetical protein